MPKAVVKWMKKQEDETMDHGEKAAQLFLSGCNCAQSVFLAFADVTRMEEGLSRRLSSPFGGGMGRQREVCGAVSGMLMVLGLLYGYEEPGAEDEYKRTLYRQVQDLCGRFRRETGSIICREILKNPPSDPNPSPRTAQYYAARPCARMVMTAARLLDEFLEENPREE